MNTIIESFPVTGLSCASCAASAQSILRAQEGVVEAEVNFASGSANITYDSSVVDAAALKSAVQSVGYDLLIDKVQGQSVDMQEELAEKNERSKQRLILSSLFTLPLVVLAMFFMHLPYVNFIMWALASPVVLVFGREFFVKAWMLAKHRQANMDTLVATGTGIAYLFSVFNTVFPDFWIAKGLDVHVYFEASAVVICFILLGRYLEENAKADTGIALRKLIGLQPNEVVRLVADGRQETVLISNVKVGDRLLVKPGEKIPVDGLVDEGQSYVDESAISGEAIAVLKDAGARVLAGTINQKGSFSFIASKVGEDTLLAHIIATVRRAQDSKAPVQRLVDKIAGIFVPVVISIAALCFVVWMLSGVENAFSLALLSMVTVLVIACPCAMGLATPTAIMVGVGKGAENGILIRDAESLERARAIDVVVLDKTGTITEGKPRVIDVNMAEDLDCQSYLTLLKNIEQRSEHPLAEAFAALDLANFEQLEISSFVAVPGGGISAMYNGERYLVGNIKLIETYGFALDPRQSALLNRWYDLAYTVVAFAGESRVLALVAIADKVKENSGQAISRLKEMGIKVIMLTGDNEHTAAAIASKMNISEFRASMLPADKANYVRTLQEQGQKVAMIGDGINDSEALAVADLSIAMGQGADIAMDIARITLISSDLVQVPKALRLSYKTASVIRQNLFWAFIYNIIGIPLAAGLLYPINGFLLNPMIAGAAMALSSVSVVANSLRLRFISL